MRTTKHQQHIDSRIAHNDCQECRADCERQFLRPQWPGYAHVSEYLEWAKPRLATIKQAKALGSARWQRDFILALHRRITLKVGGEQGRKRCDSYLQRMDQFPRSTEAIYLRRFAQRGASTLH